MSDMSRVLPEHVSRLKNGVDWDKVAPKCALTLPQSMAFQVQTFQ